MDFDVEGVKILEKGVVIVKDDCSTQSQILGMNFMHAVFKREKSALSPQNRRSQQAGKEPLPLCSFHRALPEIGPALSGRRD